MKTNVLACGLSWSLHFQARWYYSVSRDFLVALFHLPGMPITVHPRDQSKLDMLRQQPTLFLTAHVHNWERLAAWLPRQGVPLLGAARALSSPPFDRLLAWLRSRRGIAVVTREVLPRAQEHLRKGGCFGVLWDQHSSRSRFRSRFFGLPAAMDPLPGILVGRYQPRVMVGFLLPTGRLRLVEIGRPGSPWRARMDPPPMAYQGPQEQAAYKGPGRDSERMARRYHQVLEVIVRAYPHLWYGFAHRRFKEVLAYPSS